MIEYWAEPDAVAAVLPPGLEPFAEDPGPVRGALRRLAVAARTRGEELVDPARGQYKEFFVVVNALARRRGT